MEPANLRRGTALLRYTARIVQSPPEKERLDLTSTKPGPAGTVSSSSHAGSLYVTSIRAGCGCRLQMEAPDGTPSDLRVGPSGPPGVESRAGNLNTQLWHCHCHCH